MTEYTKEIDVSYLVNDIKVPFYVYDTFPRDMRLIEENAMTTIYLSDNCAIRSLIKKVKRWHHNMRKMTKSNSYRHSTVIFYNSNITMDSVIENMKDCRNAYIHSINHPRA